MDYIYKATKKDIKTIEEGVNTVFDSRLSFIFKDKTALEKFLIVSFDSQFIFCWTTEQIPDKSKYKTNIPNKKDIFLYKIPHKLFIPIEARTGWYASIFINDLDKIIPKQLLDDISLPKMSGSMLGDFIAMQKNEKGNHDNPYIFREGYLATIIHEFGHLYYNQVTPSIRMRSLKFLEHAEELFSGRIPRDLTNPYISYMPAIDFFFLFGEVYAICAEIYASSVFYSKHEELLSLYSLNSIQYLLQEENTKNTPFSAFENQYLHTIAAALGKIYMHLYPSDWPEIIINYPTFWPKDRYN